MKRQHTTLPLLALVLAVGAAAFSPKEKAPAPALDTLYFQFTGDAAIGDEYRLEANWMESTASGTGCNGQTLPCVVKAEHISGVTDLESFVQHLDSQTDDGESFVSANTVNRRP